MFSTTSKFSALRVSDSDFLKVKFLSWDIIKTHKSRSQILKPGPAVSQSLKVTIQYPFLNMAIYNSDNALIEYNIIYIITLQIHSN